jgi:hypothetical protein
VDVLLDHQQVDQRVVDDPMRPVAVANSTARVISGQMLNVESLAPTRAATPATCVAD